MNKFKVRDIMKLEPCEDYTEEYIEELWKGKKQLSLEEILNLNIDIDDRLWVLARLVPTEILPKWAQYCADKANEYDDATDTEADAYWAARWADTAARAVACWVNIYAAAAARAAANAAEDAGENREETLYNLLTTLIEMTEEN